MLHSLHLIELNMRSVGNGDKVYHFLPHPPNGSFFSQCSHISATNLNEKQYMHFAGGKKITMVGLREEHFEKIRKSTMNVLEADNE